MSSRRQFLHYAAASTLAPLFPTSLFAQDSTYPSRDIHLICMFPPGTGADIFVRFYGDKLRQASGRTIIVENKAGAFGNIATEFVARSKPDGYTLYIAPGSSVLAGAPSLFKKLSFDPVNDFEHITTLSKLPFILLVAADGPYKTVADLVSDLRAKGDKGTYGSTANTGLISSELFKRSFGLQTAEVKYRDAAGLLNDLIGGNIAFGHIDAAAGVGLLANGKVRALATSSKERFVSLPDVPSASEVGINSDIIAWWSVHAPKGTPRPILEKLEGWFNKIAVDEDVKKFLGTSGSDPFPGNSALLKDLLVKETKAWADYVKLAKIEPV